MARWSDKSHEDRQPEDPKQPAKSESGNSDSRTQRTSGTQRRIEHDPHRWRRGDRPTTAAEWEVEQFHDSFGFDTPRA